jgi:hypothetical protein
LFPLLPLSLNNCQDFIDLLGRYPDAVNKLGNSILELLLGYPEVMAALITVVGRIMFTGFTARGAADERFMARRLRIGLSPAIRLLMIRIIV